jgi:hypothetical protein
MKLRKSEIGYAAGIFDIHGSIKILIPDKEDQEPSLYMKVTAKNINLMKFLQLFDAVVGASSGGQFRAKWKDENACRFLKLLLPYLIVKKEQAELGIEFWESRIKAPQTKETANEFKVRLSLLKRDDLDE